MRFNQYNAATRSKPACLDAWRLFEGSNGALSLRDARRLCFLAARVAKGDVGEWAGDLPALAVATMVGEISATEAQQIARTPEEIYSPGLPAPTPVASPTTTPFRDADDLDQPKVRDLDLYDASQIRYDCRGHFIALSQLAAEIWPDAAARIFILARRKSGANQIRIYAVGLQVEPVIVATAGTIEDAYRSAVHDLREIIDGRVENRGLLK